MKVFISIALWIVILFWAITAYSESEQICFTWINTNYTSGNPTQKLIYNADGTFAGYPKKDATDPIRRGTFTIFKKWKDAKGSIWYRIKWDGHWGERGYELAKVSNNGKTLEYVMKDSKWPADINVKDTSYCQYTRR